MPKQFAETSVTVTSEPTDTTASATTEATADVNTEESLDGITVEEPASAPSGLGLFWRGLRERVTIALTVDPVKGRETNPICRGKNENWKKSPRNQRVPKLKPEPKKSSSARRHFSIESMNGKTNG